MAEVPVWGFLLRDATELFLGKSDVVCAVGTFRVPLNAIKMYGMVVSLIALMAGVNPLLVSVMGYAFNAGLSANAIPGMDCSESVAVKITQVSKEAALAIAAPHWIVMAVIAILRLPRVAAGDVGSEETRLLIVAAYHMLFAMVRKCRPRKSWMVPMLFGQLTGDNLYTLWAVVQIIKMKRVTRRTLMVASIMSGAWWLALLIAIWPKIKGSQRARILLILLGVIAMVRTANAAEDHAIWYAVAALQNRRRGARQWFNVFLFKCRNGAKIASLWTLGHILIHLFRWLIRRANMFTNIHGVPINQHLNPLFSGVNPEGYGDASGVLMGALNTQRTPAESRIIQGRSVALEVENVPTGRTPDTPWVKIKEYVGGMPVYLMPDGRETLYPDEFWVPAPRRNLRVQTMGMMAMVLILMLPVPVGSTSWLPLDFYNQEKSHLTVAMTTVSVAFNFIWTTMWGTTMALLQPIQDAVWYLTQGLITQAPIHIADMVLIWTIIVFGIGILRRRITGYGSTAAIFMLAIIRWSGLQWYWNAFIATCMLGNCLCCMLKTYPRFLGLLPLLFLTSWGPVTFFMVAQAIGLEVPVPSNIYLLAYFGTVALEFAPLLARQVLIIVKDPKSGRILKQERESGPLTYAIFGPLSVEWDALFVSSVQSDTIGAVVDRTRIRNLGLKLNQLWAIVDQKILMDMQDPNNVQVVTDQRATGYITQNGAFIANCQAVRVNDLVAILANIHAVYDKDGELRKDLLYHFPGQELQTKAVPMLTAAGNDLALLKPDAALKCAWRVTTDVPNGHAIVAGYHKDMRPFQRIIVRPKAGLAQIDLQRGHSGCALVTECGRLCGILWLTAENASLAQFVGLNPLAMATKTELAKWNQSVTVEEKRDLKSKLNDVRTKLKTARMNLLREKAAKHPDVVAANVRLKELEDELAFCQEEQIADLIQEHKMYIQLAEEVLSEKKPLLQRMKIIRSEKEKLLQERNKLMATDTKLVSDLRKEAKELDAKLKALDEQLKEEYAYKPPQESRMPNAVPKIKWPIVYREGEKWICHWSLTERQEFEVSPFRDLAFMERVCSETGFTRKQALRYVTGHMYNEAWAKSLLKEIQGTEMESSVISSIEKWWFGTSKVWCGYCDKEFVCNEVHKHDDKCHKKNMLDCERHADYCGSNSYRDSHVFIDGWAYPYNQGRLGLGHGKFLVTSCGNPNKQHVCLLEEKPTKVRDFFRVNGPVGKDLWVARRCVEQLHKNYAESPIAMPENESLMELIKKKNETHNVIKNLQSAKKDVSTELAAVKFELKESNRRAAEAATWSAKTDVEVTKMAELLEQKDEEIKMLREQIAQLKGKTGKVVESSNDEKDAILQKPIKPFVEAAKKVHAVWSKVDKCGCHNCICRKEKCLCPEKLCIWCNAEDHNTATCDKAINRKCAECGQVPKNAKNWCCEGDMKCVICRGNHHPQKCSVRNKAYWSAKNKWEDGIRDWKAFFSKPENQIAPPSRSAVGASK